MLPIYDPLWVGKLVKDLQDNMRIIYHNPSIKLTWYEKIYDGICKLVVYYQSNTVTVPEPFELFHSITGLRERVNDSNATVISYRKVGL